ncbi:MAG: hypothetical protein ACP5E5_11450, partial [Acidobacteriaceae bacterium]
MNQTINQNGSSFGVSVNNHGTELNTPITDLNLGMNSDGPGYYDNSGPWAGHSALGISFLNNSPGIDQAIHGNFTDLKTGDAAWEYDYLLYYGGAYYGSDEGLQAINLKPQQVGYFQGNLTTPTAGSLWTPSNPAPAGPSGYTQLYYSNGAFFSGSGTLVSVTVAFGTDTAPTAQTDYIVIWTPGSGSSATINAVLPVSVAATAGNQTFTASDFGTVNITAGEGIGFYVPSGPGATGVASAGSFCSTSSGVPVVGPITTIKSDAACGWQGSIVMQASLTAPTTGAQALAVNNFGCYSHTQGCAGQAGWEWATGGILLDMQNSTPTQATFVSQPNTIGISVTLGSNAVTESTAWGSVGSCTPNTTNMNNQVPNTDTCQITLSTSPASPGNFVAGEDACIAGPYQEEVPITSVGTTASGVQAITFTTYHNWTWGIIMQGGPCGQFVVNNNNLVSGTNFWPVAFQVLGALAPNQIVLANCVTGGCINGATTPTPELIYAGLQNTNIASLSRTNNVVSASPDTSISSGAHINTFAYPVGATINVTGCTVDTDLNGTYSITASSQDNINPVLQWAQTGSDEGPDTTCSINSGYPTFTFYPGAFINSSAGTSGMTLQQNQVPWNSGDLVREAPASTYNENDIIVTHGQQSMAYNNESQLILQDLGPTLVDSNITVQNFAAGTGQSGWMLDANGSWNAYFALNNVPANNGCIICEFEGNPGKGSYSPPYYLFNAGGGTQIMVDTVNGYFWIPENLASGSKFRAQQIGIYNSGIGSAPLDNTTPQVNIVASAGLGYNGDNPTTSTLDLYTTGSEFGIGLGSGTTFNGLFTAANATGQISFPLTPTVNGTPVVVSNDSTLA